MGRDAFKPKHASSVSISKVIDTGVNNNLQTSKLGITVQVPFERRISREKKNIAKISSRSVRQSCPGFCHKSDRMLN